MKKPKMHWLYLLFGGFIIGILGAIFLPFLWTLAFTSRRIFGSTWTPTRLLQKFWGYW